MEIRGVFIQDTFAEAFGMRAARLVITARTLSGHAKRAELTGSPRRDCVQVRGGIERELGPNETPDARPGVSVLFFTMDLDSLGKRLIERVGQTC